MRFAKIIFYIAFAWGLLILTPLYFMFDLIGRQDPPPITHPGFYYGFVGIALIWQFVFFAIAKDPVRFRPLMVLSSLEKFSYCISLAVLYLQHRLHASDLIFSAVDAVLAVLFVIAFLNTSEKS
jgi:hypothetical protein